MKRVLGLLAAASIASADVSISPVPSGKPVCGLQASLRAERADLCQGETLILKFSVVNTARKPASWVLIQNWDLSTPESGRSNSSAHARVVIRQKTGERPKRMRWASG